MVLEITRSENERVETALAFMSGAMMFPGGVRVVRNSRGIRVGDLLSIDKTNLTGSMVKVAKVARLTTGVSATDTSARVDDAHPFEVGDEVAVGSASAQTCTGVNYDTNTITVDTAWGSSQSSGASVSCSTDEQDVVVAVANLPVVDANAYRTSDKANLVTPMTSDAFYADAYVAGTFYALKLNGGNLFSTNSDGAVNLHAAYNDVFGANGLNGFFVRANGLVMVGSPSGNLGYQSNV